MRELVIAALIGILLGLCLAGLTAIGYSGM